MKKLLATVMAVTMTVSLAACSGKTTVKTETVPATSSVQTVKSEQSNSFPIKTGTFTTAYSIGISDLAETGDDLMFGICGGYEVNQGSTLIEENPEAKAAFDKATECLAGAIYEPIAYLGKQIVAGTNYSFLCRMTPSYPGFEGHFVIVVVYQNLEGNAEITNVKDIDISGTESIEEETEPETEQKCEIDYGTSAEADNAETADTEDLYEKK